MVAVIPTPPPVGVPSTNGEIEKGRAEKGGLLKGKLEDVVSYLLFFPFFLSRPPRSTYPSTRIDPAEEDSEGP